MEQRKRASKACRQCRQSKVKCDVAQKGVPCSRCSSIEEASRCQLLPSRRGGHRQHSIRDTQIQSQAHEQHQRSTPAVTVESNATALEGSLGNPHDWIGVFENFLLSRGKDAAIEDASITFLGESFPLSHLFELDSTGRRLQLHHPAPQRAETSLSPQTPSQRPSADEAFLAAKGCLSAPSAECLEVLVPTFVKRFYPLYPVVILPDFLQRLQDGTLSLAVLHAACCAACSFCSLAELTPLGFKSRKEARDTFYLRAKLIFDFGYEKDKVALLQTITLLSFWPSGPDDVWNFYHRISFGVTLCESLGIHRSMTRVNMPQKTKSLLKRIWAVLQLRDLFGAALFGRPLRINDSQCDVDQIDLGDFEHDSTFYNDQWLPLDVQQHYFVQAVRLSAIVRPIFRLRTQSAAQLEHQMSFDSLRVDLHEWHAFLPDCLAWTEQGTHSNTFSKVLSIFYNNALILTLLPNASEERGAAGSNSDFANGAAANDSMATAHDSAENILTVASNLTTHNALNSVPHELFTGLFLAQVVLNANTTTDSHDSKLFSARSNTFQMIWHQVKDFWEPASWIMHLFAALPKDRELNAGDPPTRNDEMSSIDGNNAAASLLDWNMDASFTDLQPYLGDLSIFDQGWPSHPVLSNLFEP